MRVLITGFGPFPGAPFNPSAALVKALARRRRPALAGIVRTAHIFATTYDAVDRDLPKLFAQKPDIILMFGLAGSRRRVCIETRARNAVSLLYPDASGQRPQRGIIVAGGRALRGNAPFVALLAALQNAAIPTRLSSDAGRYLCNYSYWRALERAGHGHQLVQFVHIPRVRFDPRRRRKTRSVAFRPLVTATEKLLVALIAAKRQRLLR
jgi:pyroglutamyl-peptidase